MAVVASAEVGQFEFPNNADPKRLITDAEVVERTWRACNLGSAACGQPDISVDSRMDGSGIADVVVDCDRSNCGMNSYSLGASLVRLRTQAATRAKTAQASRK